MTVKVYCDGGYKKREGSGRTYAYGSWVCESLNSSNKKFLLGKNIKTSTDAEAETLLRTLIHITKNIKDDSENVVLVYLDCRNVVKLVEKRIRNNTKKIENKTHRRYKYITVDIASLIRDSEMKIKLIWVNRKQILKKIGH